MEELSGITLYLNKREKNGNDLKVWEGREIKEKRKMVLSSKIKKE